MGELEVLAQHTRPLCSLLLAGVTLRNTLCSTQTRQLKVTQLLAALAGHRTASQILENFQPPCLHEYNVYFCVYPSIMCNHAGKL